MANKNFPETYYQTLTEVFWPLSEKNCKKFVMLKSWKPLHYIYKL